MIVYAQADVRASTDLTRSTKHDEAPEALWRATHAEVVAIAGRGDLIGCQPIPPIEVWMSLTRWAPTPLDPIDNHGFRILADPAQPKRARAKKVAP